ncbi:unnamed protein product [Victoria cruziana]
MKSLPTASTTTSNTTATATANTAILKDMKAEEPESVSSALAAADKGEPPSAASVSAMELGLIEEEMDKKEETLISASMEDDPPSPATVFCIRLKQPQENLRHKMSVPELCRNFSAVAWCGKLNLIACAAETCARLPSYNVKPPFWIPIHVVNPERPTESAIFNIAADSPRDSVQFIKWSPISCPRALLIANFHGRVSIWTQPSCGPVNLVRDATCWQCEHEWRQDLAVVTKWLSGTPRYHWLSSNCTSNSKLMFEEKYLSFQPQTSDRWPNFLCICSVFSSGSIQLHWSQWPAIQNGARPKWFSTSKGLLGAGPSGIMAADAIVTEAGTLHVAGVPIVNPSTVVVWEVTPGPGSNFQTTVRTSTNNGIPPSLNLPSWVGFAPLAAYLFSWREHLGVKHKKLPMQDVESDESVSLHCLPVSNFSAYVSPEAAAQSTATTTWGSSVTSVAFDPTRGGAVIAVVIVEVSLNGVIAMLDADFHSLPSVLHRQQHGPSLDKIKCRLLEGTAGQEVRALVLDMQARLLLDMLGKGIESALLHPESLITEPWHASSETLSSLDSEAMTVEPALISSIQAYVDAVLDLASHFITRLRRYASFCRTLGHAVGASAGNNSTRVVMATPNHGSTSCSTSQSGQNGASSIGSTHMQTWVQGAIAKINSTADGTASMPNPMTGPSPFMPISINTGTFPGTPAVRLIGDCHFLHRLCQLLLFCLFFRRKQLPRLIGAVQRSMDSNPMKSQSISSNKGLEEINMSSRPAPGATKLEESQSNRVVQSISCTKSLDELPTRPPRFGFGNVGQGYTSEENMPRPRGADAAGLLLRELELHPPSEEWHKRNMFGGPWSALDDSDLLNQALNKPNALSNKFHVSASRDHHSSSGSQAVWPRKRRLSERDAAFGLRTSVGLGGYIGVIGSRRDVVTAVWKTGLEGVWYKILILFSYVVKVARCNLGGWLHLVPRHA